MNIYVQSVVCIPKLYRLCASKHTFEMPDVAADYEGSLTQFHFWEFSQTVKHNYSTPFCHTYSYVIKD